MLRHASVEGIDLDTFQTDYNLQASGKGPNSFAPIIAAVRSDRPDVDISRESFANSEAGAQSKVARIRELVEAGIPCGMAIARGQKGPWHIVPVIEVDDDNLTTLWQYPAGGKPAMRTFTLKELKRRHKEWEGGNDIAYFETAAEDDD